MNNEHLLKVINLSKHYPVEKGIIFSRRYGVIKAVDKVSFEMKHGETIGIVGESGCGKSTLGRLILRLIPKTEGKIIFDGIDIYNLKPEELRKLRAKMQIVFQDPQSSLNPRIPIGEIIAEPLKIHKKMTRKELKKEVEKIMEESGLDKTLYWRYPHELSGGQKQRVGIARAISLKPSFIVADEPVSSLDVSIQAQILNLFVNLKKLYRLSYLFISHNLAVIKHISDKILIMYFGRLLEIADKNQIYDSKTTIHPYTSALLNSIMEPYSNIKQKEIIKGDLPDPLSSISGCVFRTRCPKKMEICSSSVPQLKEIEKNHFIACHLYN